VRITEVFTDPGERPVDTPSSTGVHLLSRQHWLSSRKRWVDETATTR
jgi:hypothetical protein